MGNLPLTAEGCTYFGKLLFVISLTKGESSNHQGNHDDNLSFSQRLFSLFPNNLWHLSPLTTLGIKTCARNGRVQYNPKMRQQLFYQTLHINKKNDLWDNSKRQKRKISNSKAGFTWAAPETPCCLSVSRTEWKRTCEHICVSVKRKTNKKKLFPLLEV